MPSPLFIQSEAVDCSGADWRVPVTDPQTDRAVRRLANTTTGVLWTIVASVLFVGAIAAAVTLWVIA